jgi:thioesterase domain-containing protein
VLLGYSAGGQIALALAQALRVQGHPVRAVVLIDTWRWDGVEPEVRQRLRAQLPQGDGPLSAAYLACLEQLPPVTTLDVPVHHLLAHEDAAAAPGGSRDWRALAGAGYAEQRVAGGHHALFDTDHLAGTVAALRPLLAGGV